MFVGMGVGVNEMFKFYEGMVLFGCNVMYVEVGKIGVFLFFLML